MKISSRLLQILLKITPGALAAALVVAAGSKAVAVDKPVTNTIPFLDKTALNRITSVSQLSDVQPTDWAFQALQNLVERYGCIAGYPDGSFRGNRAMTRYEFAAGLNACLETITQLIGSADTSRLATREDLAVLQRLMEEFSSELATLRGRVDSLEARTAELEANQFSTTTKLNGEIIFAVADSFGKDTNTATIIGQRTRLNFDTSFTGEDLLRTRLQIVGLDAFSANSHPAPEGDLRFAAGAYSTGSNDVAIDALLYSFPIGKKTRVVIEANAGAVDDFANTVNPYIDGDGASGALSNFATRNSIYYLINNAGIGVRHEFSERLEVSLGYLATNAFDPKPGNGFFNGAFGALAQVTFKPSARFTLGLTYLNSYNNDMLTGSNRANLRTVLANQADLDLPTSSNSYGLQASWQVSKRFIIGGWVGYTNTQVLSTLGGQIDRGDMDIWNGALTLTFPNLGKQGNVAAIIVGVEPMVRNSSVSAAVPGLPDVFGADKNTSVHVEAFYEYKLTDNIAITPGIIWLTAPDHNKNNEDIVIGVVRTTFSF
ncbi:MAG: iron uptake porin [Oscillatoriaceae bacterium SKW80]|nr:iron uptake porin [Oscillatoriaceae bacterium SKYG93]MCX8121478.1 iron uptake porin [Oscillatoriaceae bacterium SKW80]MDW8452936.1 iron uptake porin [Oscillatoriaceae cyanobacterium SKYGB_i_bin93]HIK27825.1 iron uptake porin [Oscillatoriaceae cyanobacterium M7585_C2015_266]